MIPFGPHIMDGSSVKEEVKLRPQSLVNNEHQTSEEARHNLPLAVRLLIESLNFDVGFQEDMIEIFKLSTIDL